MKFDRYMKTQNHRPQNMNGDFDIFSSHSELFEPPVIKKEKNYLGAFLAFVAVVAVFVSAIAFIYKPKGINPYSLVAVRTLTSSGNSVGGAKVFVDGEPLGLTDSFGEWRKYMRLDESDKHTIRVEKTLSGKKFTAEKMFSIRFEQDKVSEVSVSLELKSEKKLFRRRRLRKRSSSQSFL